MLKEFDLVCVTETELLQWQARGIIHMASNRVLLGGIDKSSMFALAPFVKLDDAKARVIVRLVPNLSDEDMIHPSFRDPNVFSVHWDKIQSVCPALPQFRRRLDGFNLPIEDWDITALWDDWLVTQGCYERFQNLQDILGKIGFNNKDFLADSHLLGSIVRNVVRPQSAKASSFEVPFGWHTIFQNRDEILKRLRFEGHCDRVSFLEASISEILKVNGHGAAGLKLEELISDRDSGWQFQDLSSAVLDAITRVGGDTPLSMTHKISPIFGAAYMRLYDELFYGQKSWPLCLNLLRFLKYSIDSREADFLTIAILASFPPEELRALELPKLFL